MRKIGLLFALAVVSGSPVMAADLRCDGNWDNGRPAFIIWDGGKVSAYDYYGNHPVHGAADLNFNTDAAAFHLGSKPRPHGTFSATRQGSDGRQVGTFSCQ